jgi:isoleucyl-tRNA synthetase
MLSLLADLDAKMAQAVDDFDYNTYTRLLADFCNEDLSAFYFDIRKDVLYCDLGPAAPLGTDTRRAYRSVLDVLFHALVRYAAPVLVFTSEEVWGTRYPQAGSVHLLEWPILPDLSTLGSRVRGNDELKERWAELRQLRNQVNEAIEPLRREKIVRSSLEANVVVGDHLATGFTPPDLAELFITASVERMHGDAVTITPTTDHKCGRCWRHLPEVADDGALCNRCETVLGEG